MNPDDPVSDRPARDDAAERSATAEREGLPFLSSVTNDMLVPGLVENLPVEWARANRLLPAYGPTTAHHPKADTATLPHGERRPGLAVSNGSSASRLKVVIRTQRHQSSGRAYSSSCTVIGAGVLPR